MWCEPIKPSSAGSARTPRYIRKTGPRGPLRARSWRALKQTLLLASRSRAPCPPPRAVHSCLLLPLAVLRGSRRLSMGDDLRAGNNILVSNGFGIAVRPKARQHLLPPSMAPMRCSPSFPVRRPGNNDNPACMAPTFLCPSRPLRLLHRVLPHVASLLRDFFQFAWPRSPRPRCHRGFPPPLRSRTRDGRVRHSNEDRQFSTCSTILESSTRANCPNQKVVVSQGGGHNRDASHTARSAPAACAPPPPPLKVDRS